MSIKDIEYALLGISTSIHLEEMDGFDGYIIRDNLTKKALFCVYAKPPYNERVSLYEAYGDERGYDLADERMLGDNLTPAVAASYIWARLYEMNGGKIRGDMPPPNSITDYQLWQKSLKNPGDGEYDWLDE